MATKQVAIRLGTEGKQQVKSDFGELKSEGTGAMKAIADGAKLAGDVGEREAKRLSSAYDRATADIEAADRRRARAAEKLSLISSQSDVQARIGSAVSSGYGDYTGSARASAQVFAQMAEQQERLELRARALMSVIDPLWAAQQRYNTELAEAKTLLAAGAISADHYAQAEMRAKAALDAASVAQQRHNGLTGAGQAGMQQLGFQVQDFTVQVAGGTSAVTAFSMQLPQAISAATLMMDRTTKLGAFLGGPWGILLATATSVLVPLIAHLVQSGDAAEGAAAKVDRYTDALKRLREEQGTSADEGQALVRIARIEEEMLDPKIRRARGESPDGYRRRQEERRAELRLEKDELEQQVRWNEAVRLVRDKAKPSNPTPTRSPRVSRGRTGPDPALAAQRLADERASIMSGFQDRFDPAAAIVRRRDEDLALLAKIQSLLSAEQVKMFSEGILGDAKKAQFKLNFPDDERRQEAIKRYVIDQKESLTIAEQEGLLVGKSADERERVLSTLRLQQQLRRDGIDLEGEEGQQILANHAAILAKNEAIAASADAWHEVQQMGENFIDTVLNPQSWRDWGDLGKQVLQDLMNDMIRLAAINPLKNALFGTDLPVLGGVLKAASGFLGGGSLEANFDAAFPGNASGTERWSGGRTWVGEFGKELVDLPAGSKITPAHHTRRMLANDNGGGMNVPININIDATGADPAGLARVEAQVAQLERKLPGDVIRIVGEAKSRRIL